MPKERLPYIALYIGDWLKDDVSGCSLAAQGLWIRMMFLMHESERYGYLCKDSKPTPPDAVARRCGSSLDQYLALLTELMNAGVPSTTDTGIIYSRRMVRDAEIREIRAKAGHKGGKKSWKARVKASKSFAKAKVEAKPKQNPDTETEYVVNAVNGDGVEGGRGVDPPKPYVLRTDPVSKVVYAYKIVKGCDLEDREWDRRQWARTARGAEELLSIFKGNVTAAQNYMKAFSDDYEKKKLSFTIETMVKNYDDWRLERGKAVV